MEDDDVEKEEDNDVKDDDVEGDEERPCASLRSRNALVHLRESARAQSLSAHTLREPEQWKRTPTFHKSHLL